MQVLSLIKLPNTLGTILVPEGFDPEHVRIAFRGGEGALFIHGNLHTRSDDAEVIARAFNEFFEFRGVSITHHSFFMHMS